MADRTRASKHASLASLGILLAAFACGHDWSTAGEDALDGDALDGDTLLDDGGVDLPETPSDRADDAPREVDAPESGGDGDAADADADEGNAEAADDADDAPPDEAEDDTLPPDDAAPDIGPEDVVVPECTSDPECDDGDPCTRDFCDPGVERCVHSPLDEGTACGALAVCCGGVCTGSTDVSNCGGCGIVCTAGAHATATCDGTSCGLACDPGWQDCAGAADGCESEAARDEAHCGTCGNDCANSETCSAAACVPSWTATTTIGAPDARRHHRAVWTGTEMLLFGGNTAAGSFLDGGRYLAAENRWLAMTDPTLWEVHGATGHAPVWTGIEMITWGGATPAGVDSPCGTGGLYDPAADGWAGLSTAGDPAARQYMSVVWTGSEMLVWGGTPGATAVLGDGARYDPSADAWTPIAATGAPSARWGAATVWTGSEMLVWSGYPSRSGTAVAGGARYDPTTNTWTPMSSTGAPAARGYTVAVWTGSEMLVWSGAAYGALGGAPGSPLSDGGAYNPTTDRWRSLATAGAPSARFQAAGVWTGSTMIVWGGTADIGDPAFDTGGIYDPIADAWTPVTTIGAPTGRRAHAAVWTGDRMVVWGGSTASATGTVYEVNTGGRYLPR